MPPAVPERDQTQPCRTLRLLHASEWVWLCLERAARWCCGRDARLRQACPHLRGGDAAPAARREPGRLSVPTSRGELYSQAGGMCELCSRLWSRDLRGCVYESPAPASLSCGSTYRSDRAKHNCGEVSDACVECQGGVYFLVGWKQVALGQSYALGGKPVCTSTGTSCDVKGGLRILSQHVCTAIGTDFC